MRHPRPTKKLHYSDQESIIYIKKVSNARMLRITPASSKRKY